MKYLSLFVVFAQICWSTANFWPRNTVSVIEKEGFLTYLIPITDFGVLRSCKVTIKGISYDLDPTLPVPFKHTLPSGVEVQRYSDKLCGVRVKKISLDVKSDWAFDAVDDRGRTDKSVLPVDVIDFKMEPSVQNMTVPLDGNLKRIRCPNSDAARFCEMANNNDEVFPNSCERSAELTNRNNRWTCQVFRWGNMNSYDGVVNVAFEGVKQDAINEMYETDHSLVLSCKVTRSASQCRAEMPGKQKKFILFEGWMTEHYSVGDTLTSQGKCVIEIEKPLRPDDLGIWRIFYDFGVSEINHIGCVYNVANTTSRSGPRYGVVSRRPRSNRDNPTAIELMGDRTTTTTIRCEVAYEISYCYLQPPNGQFGWPEFVPINFQNTRYLGQCRFNVVNITSGLWACGVNDQLNGEDRLTYYQVLAHDQPGQVVVEKVKAERGDGVKLLCKTVMQQPMNYCRFTTPLGTIHGLSKNTQSIPGSRYHYFGHGLAGGECGIEIDNLQAEDFGDWLCTFQISSKEYTLKMELDPQALSMAAAWGLGIGLAVIVMLGSGWVGHRYFMSPRRQYRSAGIRNEQVVQHNMASVSDVSSQSHNS